METMFKCISPSIWEKNVGQASLESSSCIAAALRRERLPRSWIIILGGFHKWGIPNIWLVDNGKSYENGWFRGTPILGNFHLVLPRLEPRMVGFPQIHPWTPFIETPFMETRSWMCMVNPHGSPIYWVSRNGDSPWNIGIIWDDTEDHGD